MSNGSVLHAKDARVGLRVFVYRRTSSNCVRGAISKIAATCGKEVLGQCGNRALFNIYSGGFHFPGMLLILL